MKALEKVWSWIRSEPMAALALFEALVTLAATFGFELTPEQRQAILAIAGPVVAMQAGSRFLVTPSSKLKDAGLGFDKLNGQWRVRGYDEPGAGLKGI